MCGIDFVSSSLAAEILPDLEPHLIYIDLSFSPLYRDLRFSD